MRPTPNNSRSRGFTLIEVLVAMAIAGIVTAVMYATLKAQVRGQVSQDVSLSMTQSVRAAMEILASDIRMAGCDPNETADAQILTAEEGNLVMTMDVGGGPNGEPDGDTDDPNELVRYAINASGHLGRATGAAGALQPLHSIDLACDALNFVYLDANGNPIGTPVAAAALETIRAVQVSIVVRSADANNPGLLKDQIDNTSYTNLQGDEIFKADGDTFRRFQLNETIARRN